MCTKEHLLGGPYFIQGKLGALRKDIVDSSKSLSTLADSLNEQNFAMSDSSSAIISPSRRSMSGFAVPDPSNSHCVSSLFTSLPPNNARQNSIQLGTLKKPELKFSIERILGLTSDSSTPAQLSLENRSSGRYFVDDNDDNEDVEDDDKDECIDVDDSGELTDHFRANLHNNDFARFHDSGDATKYQWLQCTRYHPPKLQRSKKKECCKKKKLGRNPRVPFTQHQVVVLEEKFRRTHYLSSMDVAELSNALNLTETRVKIWFQNRRARERRDKETSQRNPSRMVQKSFQPLTIPAVTWPIPAAMSTTNYVQYPNGLNFRSGYLSSTFGMYSSRKGSEDPREARSDTALCMDKIRLLQEGFSPSENM